jgi:hypothetical protein
MLEGIPAFLIAFVLQKKMPYFSRSFVERELLV